MSRAPSSRRILWVLSLISAWMMACGGDDSSEKVTVGTGDEAPKRIIAIAPSITEMLFTLGLGDRVVGVGDYAKWPSEVVSKPKLGGLFDSRLEAIAALDPDLAVLLPSEEQLRSQLDRMGVEVLTVPSETLEDVQEMAVLIGERCGAEEESQAFLESWDVEMAVRQPAEPARVLLSVTREPGRMADILVSGPETFLHELLDRLGATNVMFDAKLAYPQVGLEEIIIRHPEVIIELQATPGNFDELALDWARLGENVPLTEACVRVIAGDHVLIPGPRLPRLYREIQEALDECAGKRE